VAGLAGIEVNAAVNRLSSLAKKGYVHRINRPRREGDAFVDLLSAAQQNLSTADPQKTVSTNEFDIPEEVRKGVELLASAEGVDPREVLVRAWREFLEKHRELLNSESKEVRRMLRESNHEDLAAFVNRSARERAKNAASRIKR
jgi:DNA-directed RNA polymerase subunit L